MVHDPEVAEILDDVRRRVRERHMVVPAGEPADADERAVLEMQAAVQDVNMSAKVNSHLPLLWEDMVVGRLRAFVQRVVRRLLRWYINPIVDQQNTFNAATARAITLLASENARLRYDLSQTKAQLQKSAADTEQQERQPQGE
jgi:hypothetical protein